MILRRRHRHLVLRVVLGHRLGGKQQGRRKCCESKGTHGHSSTLTSRIIPASMWYSRWQ